MDLVSHDLLNDDQAVLSYLELILATPGLDKRTVSYAKKAVSHLRSSAMRLDNVKTIFNQMKTSKPLGMTDLRAALSESADELPAVFPDKSVRVSKPSIVGRTAVDGGTLVKQLLLTVMSSVVKLDPGADVSLDVEVSGGMERGKRGWTVTVKDCGVILPESVKSSDFDKVHTKSSSLVTQISGFLFAKMAAEAIGGDFRIERDPGNDEGAAFTIRFAEAVAR